MAGAPGSTAVRVSRASSWPPGQRQPRFWMRAQRAALSSTSPRWAANLPRSPWLRCVSPGQLRTETSRGSTDSLAIFGADPAAACQDKDTIVQEILRLVDGSQRGG